MASEEIKNVFPTDEPTLQLIANGHPTTSHEAFQKLLKALPDRHTIIAYWRTSQFSNDRHYRIQTVTDLIYVVLNYRRAHCRSLRFFATPLSEVPRPWPARDLFY